MRLTPGSRMTLSQVMRLGLFLGGSVLAITVFLLAHYAISRMSREISTTSRMLAQFCAQASFPATHDTELRILVSRIIQNIDFPIVITDAAGVPRAWKGIGLDPALVPDESLDSLAAGQPVAPAIAERVAFVRRAVPLLDARNAPVPMTRLAIPDTMGWVHYGAPRVLDTLRWTPYVSLGGTLLLLGLGFWGLAILRQSEKRSIWVGMAKETAHQLGTPLSSLMGWNDALRAQLAEGPSAGGHAELAEAVTEMERDIERLRRVSDRFSNVGSVARLTRQDPAAAVREVVGYMRRRLPRAGRPVELRERLQPVPPVDLNSELIQWAIENLISNALSALDKDPGWIEVAMRPVADGREVEIVVSDNGRGMSPGERRKAFEPGYTTRRRGWGLGLPLARRVVEESHGGRIWIRDSAPGKGTAVAIRLPAAG